MSDRASIQPTMKKSSPKKNISPGRYNRRKMIEDHLSLQALFHPPIILNLSMKILDSRDDLKM